MNSPKPHQSKQNIGETIDAQTASSSERETPHGNAASESDNTATSFDGERNMAVIEKPPSDDVCPICFGNFSIPCRASCGHWFCGNCILQYWNFIAPPFKPCKCPMCSKSIIKLTPEKSLYQRHEVEISKVLQNVGGHNRMFVGGISGLLLRLLAIPSLCMKRMFHQMLNPDRPGVHLNQVQIIAVVTMSLMCLTLLPLLSRSFCIWLASIFVEGAYGMVGS